MAPLPSPTVDSIKKSLKEGRYAPVYVFHGEEGYFIDELCREFEEGILTEDEKVFDQYILYALDTEPQQVLSIVRGVPAIARQQVVILKEVQAAKAGYLDKLIPYLSEPVQSTIFVICSRGAAVKGKELMAALKKGGAVVFEGKKIKDYQIAPYIANIIKERGLTPDEKAVQMLADQVGTDLSRIHNEVTKLATLLPPNAAVTPEVVERHIGISREYNTWELIDAIAARNAVKAFKIADYFRSNPKAAPLVMVVPQIFSLFADVLTAYYVPGGSDQGIAEALEMKNAFMGLKRIRLTMSKYKPVQVVEILAAIREYDAQSKGVGSRRNEHQLFYELIYHILTATGRI